MYSRDSLSLYIFGFCRTPAKPLTKRRLPIVQDYSYHHVIRQIKEKDDQRTEIFVFIVQIVSIVFDQVVRLKPYI